MMANNKLILGIDPGLSGALAIYDADADELLAVYDTPTLLGKNGKHVTDFYNFAAHVKCYLPLTRAVIEDVSAMPGQGVTSMFNFGKSFGIAVGILGAYAVPTSFVKPGVWKMSLGLSRDKDDSRTLATKIFPHSSKLFLRKKDDGRAEAALLAHFGKRFL